MNKGSKICTILGLLLLAAALCLAASNLLGDLGAGKASSAVLEELSPEIEARCITLSPTADTPDLQAETASGFTPDYLLNPDMEMPTIEIDGEPYIGILEIPALSLELPILSSWSYSGLKIAPCRYSGTVYQNDLVIAGHNYASHFAALKDLSLGDEIDFTDADGNRFTYVVSEIESLSAYAVDEMTSGDWDFTLFTCTVGGRARLTIRCTLQ